MSSSSENDRIWYYADASTNGQRGPIPTNVLMRLLEKGISGIGATTMIWKEGMDAWLPIIQVEPFKPIAEFHVRQWFYLDHENQQKGPVFTRFLLHKLKEGEVDGLTMVFSSHLSEWTKIADIPELKAEIQKIAQEEERAETLQNSIQISESEQVFEAENATDFFDAIAADVATDSKQQGKAEEGKRILISDDGERYKWDEEEEAWVVDEDDDEEEKDEATKNEGKDRKRKAGAADLDEDDGASSGEEDEREGKDNNNGDQTQQKPKKKRKNKKRKQKGPNTWIYVTGLPKDVTEEEIKDHFSKVGIIALNPANQQPKIKIYREEGTEICKGDCLICYNAEESVQLALDILHEGYIRPKYQISVTKASFDHGGENKGTGGGGVGGGGAKKKSSISHAQILVAKNAVKQALTWNEDDDMGISKASALRIVVLEGMFTLEEMKKDEKYADELEKDVAEEVSKIGMIDKITMFIKNPKGIIVIKFTTAFAAQECIRIFNGRFFAGRKIKCYFWDGVTNYSMIPQGIQDDEEDEKKEEERLNEFGDWLEEEQEELPEEFRLQVEQ